MTAYDKIQWRGHTFNKRTVAALMWVERKSGLTLEIAQGSYNKGGVSQSAGTHDGGGAVDLRVRQYSPAQRRKVVRYLRRAGFAAWYRKEVPGLWGPHIHAILIGDRHLSAGARQQVLAYDNHRNGLANNALDKAWRPSKRRFSYKRRKPVPR